LGEWFGLYMFFPIVISFRGFTFFVCPRPSIDYRNTVQDFLFFVWAIRKSRKVAIFFSVYHYYSRRGEVFLKEKNGKIFDFDKGYLFLLGE